MAAFVTACILFAVSVAAFVISIRSFQEKGFLWNNAYIYASKRERETMDKKPHYRQSAVVFLLIGLIFFLNGLAALLGMVWISYMALIAAACAIIYAVISGAAIEKKKTGGKGS